MEDILKRVNYDRNAAKDAFTMLNLEDTFTLSFDIYKEFVDNLISKLEDSSQKTSVKRIFNSSGSKMNRKIKSYFKEAAKNMGYLETKPDVFDRSLNQFRKSWEEVLKKKRKSTVNQAGNYTKPKLRRRLFNEIKRGTKGGRADEWSARKAQLLAQRYKKAGGGYRD
jgi:hypothetical protein